MKTNIPSIIRKIKSWRNRVAAYSARETQFRAVAKQYRGLPSIRMDDRPVGFFSMYLQMLGALRVIKLNRQDLILNFGRSPYHDPLDPSSCWWHQYFKPHPRIYAESQHQKAGEVQPLLINTRPELDAISHLGTKMRRIVAHHLSREFQIKEEILSDIKNEQLRWPARHFVIGLHYRGTDKVEGQLSESIRVGYEVVLKLLRDLFHDLPLVVYLATDEASFHAELHRQFPGKIFSISAKRSDDHLPVHLEGNQTGGYQLGREALIDATLLSKTDFLIRCDSNLSYCSLIMNLNLESVNLSSLQRDLDSSGTPTHLSKARNKILKAYTKWAR